MKYFVFLILLFSVLQLQAQEQLAKNYAPSIFFSDAWKSTELRKPNEAFLSFPKNARLTTVASSDGVFHRTYLVDENGEAYSSGFMPAAYFRPNQNTVIITGRQYLRRDSFNPYGAGDLPSMLFLGTVNNVIGKLRVNRR